MENLEPIKCATFDKKVQDTIPLEVRKRMKRDRMIAQQNREFGNLVNDLRNAETQAEILAIHRSKDEFLIHHIEDYLIDDWNEAWGNAQKHLD